MKNRIRGLVNRGIIFSVCFFVLSHCASNPSSSSGSANPRSIPASVIGGARTETPLKKDEVPRVILLYVSDLHGRLRPEPSGRGGYARLASLIKREKAEAGDQTDVLAILGGDAAGKSSLPCRQSGERECFALLGQMGFDFGVLGSWELKRHVRELNELIQLSGIKWIAENVRSYAPRSAWLPSLTYSGKRSRAELEFLSWTRAPEAEERDSKKTRIEIRENMTDRDWSSWKRKSAGKTVVLLPHLKYEDDLKLLQVACASETLSPALLLKAKGHFPRDEQVECARLIGPGPFGEFLSKTELHRGDDGKWFVKSHEFIPVDSKISEDSAVKEKVEALYRKYAPSADVVLATASRDYSELEFARWAGESFRKVARSDIAVVNLRAVSESLKAGPLTQERLAMIYPNTDDLMGFDVNAREFEKSLCTALRREKDSRPEGGPVNLLLIGAELEHPGTENCQINGPKRASYKVAMVSSLVKGSKRWLGRDYSPVAFKWQVRTDQAMQKMFEALGKKL